MILGHFRIFEKSTDRIDNENVEVGQHEANGSRELEWLLRMKVKVIYNQFWMILEHFRIFEKNDQKWPQNGQSWTPGSR